MNSCCTELIELLRKNNLKISTAESCTGGLIAKSITDVAGCSDVFYGGVVSYDNSVKMKLLGVKAETLDAYGAVSSFTAVEMAEGVARACGTEVSISTTGIAGPGGGSEEKPVGTVFVGVFVSGKSYWKRLSISPSLSRQEIRCDAVKLAIAFAVEKIIQNY